MTGTEFPGQMLLSSAGRSVRSRTVNGGTPGRRAAVTGGVGGRTGGVRDALHGAVAGYRVVGRQAVGAQSWRRLADPVAGSVIPSTR